MAVTSAKLTLTEKAPATALSSVTVNCRPVPSISVTSSTVTSAESLSVMTPVPVSVSIINGSVALSETVKVSVPSRIASSSVATVNCWVSPAVPTKLSVATTLS